MLGVFALVISMAASTIPQANLAHANASAPLQAELTGSGAYPGALFGTAVAVSEDGGTAVVGAPGAGAGKFDNPGFAYVFVRSGTGWAQQALLHNDGGVDGFGASVSISGDTLVVGATGNAFSPGAAYVFVRSGTTWTQQAMLTGSDAPDAAEFGASVSISGDTVAVGAPGYSPGVTYVFVRSAAAWTEQARIVGGLDPDSVFGVGGNFGASVSIAGDSLLVGDPEPVVPPVQDLGGAAYVFVRSGTIWTWQAELTPDGIQAHSFEADRFGWSVSLSGDTAAVGAANLGGAYVFTRSGTSWSQQAKLNAPSSFASVALSGDTILVGASNDNNYIGDAFEFVRTGTTWTQQETFSAPDRSIGSYLDGGPGDQFGYSVALSSGVAAVGAWLADGHSADEGAAYIFSVDNAPTADAGGPYVGVVGVAIPLDGSGSTDPDGLSDIVSYSWDLNNDGTFGDAVGTTPSATFATPGLHTIALRVTDSFGQTDTASTTVDVTAPVIASDTGTSAADTDTATASTGGVTATATGSGSVTVEQYGDNPGSTPAFNASGRYFDVSASLNNTFGSLTTTDCNLNGGNVVYWWTGTEWKLVTPQSYDPNGSCVTMTFDSTSSPTLAELTGTPFGVGVSDEPPNITLSVSSVTVDEGETASIAGTFSDPNGSDVTIAVSVGSVTQDSGTNGNWVWSFGTNDNSESQTVTATVTDDIGQSSVVFGLNVNNVPPKATFDAPPSVTYGSNIALSLTNPSDPSSVDTAAGFSYAFDCGTGAGYSAASSTNTAICPSGDAGTKIVKGKIVDKDGGSTEYTAGVLVTPASLTITADTQTKDYGAPLPPLTVSYSGFVNGDTAATLTTAPTVTTTATFVSPVGTYPITATGAVDADYAISYIPGTLTVTLASTALLYDGQQLVLLGDTFTPDAILTSSTGLCSSGQPVSFSLDPNPHTGTAGAFWLATPTTDSSGQASGGQFDTSTWQEGVYTITASYAGTSSCEASSDSATLTVASPGDAATGGGWQTLSGSGRVSFGFTVHKAPNTTDSYTGQLLLMNNGKWRLKGTLSNYLTVDAQGSATGIGYLYWWNQDLNRGLGDWQLAQSDPVSFTITFTAGGSNKGKGRKHSGDPGSFGIQIDYTPVAPQPPNLPNSLPVTLKGGDIKVS